MNIHDQFTSVHRVRGPTYVPTRVLSHMYMCLGLVQMPQCKGERAFLLLRQPRASLRLDIALDSLRLAPEVRCGS